MSNLKKSYLIQATMLMLMISIHSAKAAKSNESASLGEELADELEYMWMGWDEIGRKLASSSNNALDPSKAVFKNCQNNNPSYCLPNQNRNKARIYCGTRNRAC